MAPPGPASPNKLRPPASLNRHLSQSESSLRRKSSYLQDLITRQNHHKGYDREYKEALRNGEVGNGVRTWYSSFTTIGEHQDGDSCTSEMHGRAAEEWDVYTEHYLAYLTFIAMISTYYHRLAARPMQRGLAHLQAQVASRCTRLRGKSMGPSTGLGSRDYHRTSYSLHRSWSSEL